MTRRGGKLKRRAPSDTVTTRQTIQPKGTLDTLFWHRNWLNVATLSGGSTSFRRRTRGGALSTPRQVSTQRQDGTIELHSDDQLTDERRILKCLSCDRVRSLDTGVLVCTDCYREVVGR